MKLLFLLFILITGCTATRTPAPFNPQIRYTVMYKGHKYLKNGMYEIYVFNGKAMDTVCKHYYNRPRFSSRSQFILYADTINRTCKLERIR